ncbi:MAG TPA: retroviral-like aspartic protease, partial [bacterium (Candidatus Stahlbacteria)]|nr:retroviral-like aspartic protease [Candidatus Stahlbacteria bacterium]
MAVIEKPIKLKGSKGEADVVAIFDSGATYSCIQPKLAEKLGITEPLPEPKHFGTAEARVSLDFNLDGYTFSDEFMVIPGLSDPVIIGAKTLQAWRMKLDFENDEVIIDPRVTKLRLLCLHQARGVTAPFKRRKD